MESATNSKSDIVIIILEEPYENLKMLKAKMLF